jgi:hypothetical protein
VCSFSASKANVGRDMVGYGDVVDGEQELASRDEGYLGEMLGYSGHDYCSDLVCSIVEDRFTGQFSVRVFLSLVSFHPFEASREREAFDCMDDSQFDVCFRI